MPNYACGWSVLQVGGPRRLNTWHMGSLDGTSSLLVRRHNGLVRAALCNSRKQTGGKEPAGAIDPP